MIKDIKNIAGSNCLITLPYSVGWTRINQCMIPGMNASLIECEPSLGISTQQAIQGIPAPPQSQDIVGSLTPSHGLPW